MKRVLPVLFAAALALCLAGCGMKSAGDLYCLPNAPDDHYDLQEALDAVLGSGMSYAAPASGANQETVQLVDLNGDGEEEAIAFFRARASGTLFTYIFSKRDGSYQQAAVIDGEGTAVSSVDYDELDGDGSREIVLCYQVSDAVPQALNAYHLGDNGATLMLGASCSRYEITDLNGDGVREIMTISDGADGAAAMASLYRYTDGALLKQTDQQLSAPNSAIRRVHTGGLQDGTSAVFVSSQPKDGVTVTDVLTEKNGDFAKVKIRDEALTSAVFVQNYAVYPTDIDRDGVLELPDPEAFPAYGAGDPQWMVNWYSLAANGTVQWKETTYENFSENWYLDLPEDWLDTLTATVETASAAESIVMFSRWDGGETSPEPLVAIHTLKGDGRDQLAAEAGLTTLFSDEDALYAAELFAEELTPEQVMKMFHRIATQWMDDGA